MELSLSDGALRTSVADGSAVRPVTQELSHRAPRGRGIRLVATLADHWGCEDHAGGKRIWVELRPPQDTPEEQHGSNGSARLPPAIHLSARERDVLEQLASPRTLEEIADHLAVSVNTVRTHLHTIYDKLGFSSRRTAVLAARDLGLLP